MSSFQSFLCQISVSESDFCSDMSSADILCDNTKYEWDALFLDRKNNFSGFSVNSNESEKNEEKMPDYLSLNQTNYQAVSTEKKVKQNRKFVRVTEFKLEDDFLDPGKFILFF